MQMVKKCETRAVFHIRVHYYVNIDYRLTNNTVDIPAALLQSYAVYILPVASPKLPVRCAQPPPAVMQFTSVKLLNITVQLTLEKKHIYTGLWVFVG